MAKLKYLGLSQERIITEETFIERGVTDQDGVFMDTRLNREVELSDAAASLLLTAEPSDWQVVSEPEPAAEADEEDTSPEDDEV